MFIEGVVSLFQMTFLPGYLFLRLFNCPVNFLRRIIYSFAMSLLINYVIVFCLVAGGAYTRSALFSIIAIELGAILFLDFETINFFLMEPLWPMVKQWTMMATTSCKALFNFNQEYKPDGCVGRGFIIFSRFIIIGSLLSLVYLFTIFVSNILSCSALVATDDIAWNNWARDWSRCTMPGMAYHYAQLLPANWSIAYLLMGWPIQFFPKAIMPLFMLYLNVCLLDVGLLKKSLAFFIANITLPILLIHLSLDGYMTTAYTDLPVAFMGFLAISCLFVAQEITATSHVKKYLILGALFALAAGVTKQAGLYVVLVYPLLSILFLRGKLEASWKKNIWLGVCYLMGICLIVLPMYVYADVQIRNGKNRSEVYMVTHVHPEKNMVKRFRGAIRSAIESGPVDSTALTSFDVSSLWQLVFIALNILKLFIFWFALKTPAFAYIFLLVWVPFFIMWCLFFCYDARNYSLIIPIYALGMGVGIENMLLHATGFLGGMMKRILCFLGNIKGCTVVIIFLMSLVALNYVYSPSCLIEKNAVKSLQWGRSPTLFKIHKALFDFSKNNVIQKPILSEYHFEYIAAFHNYPIKNFDFGADKSFDELFKIIHNGDVGFIFFPPTANKKVSQYIEKLLQDGQLKIMYEEQAYRLMKVLCIPN